MPVILALDQGTTSSRALVFGEDGEPIASAQREFTQHYPAPGQVEHDPEQIWQTQLATAQAALAQAGLSAADVAGIGIANQRETTLLWERSTGRALAPAIVWQDRRTAAVCAQLRADGAETWVRERTGLLLDPYFSGTKLAWLLDHIDGARARAEAGELCFGTVDSWLLYRLTGGALHATDVSNASRTLLFDIQRGAWDEELCALLRVPRALLPEVRSSSEVFGECISDTGLGGVPVAALIGDQQAALFGQLCTSPGMAKNTYGTGCFLLSHAGGEAPVSANRLLSTVAWRIGGGPLEYALEGSVFIGGAVVQWLRDGLGIIKTAAEVEALALSVPDSGGVVLVPAFAGLGAPHWDPSARGTLCGITRGTTSAHIARAALDAITFQVADLLDAVTADTGAPLPELRVDGGAADNDTLMQLQADVLGVPVVRPRVTESTARGAAFLAGLATGVWSGVDDLAGRWQIDRRFEPAPGASERVAQQRARWERAVERTKGWADDPSSPAPATA
ncbi:MAG: glycerol kinase [Planctomycetota bacterium]|nr:MAG: glycerol kinase [Planctomycetota bacterium]